MSIDGFEARHANAFEGFSKPDAERFFKALRRVSRALRVEVEGIERLPTGRALVVSNHAFGWDVGFAMAEVHGRTGRFLWALGEHAWWRFPLLRRLAASVGTVDGTQENAHRLLEADELVLVQPGGLREAMKPRELRYRLLWGRRFGFVRAAIETGAPIVPLACVGADELVDWVGNPFERGARWLGRFAFPVPRPAYGLPLLHRVPLHYVFGEPIDMRGRGTDEGSLSRARREVAGALHELIDEELARRERFPLRGDGH